MCGASCGFCEFMDPKKRCTYENMGMDPSDAFPNAVADDLDSFFTSLGTSAEMKEKYDFEFLSTEPYVGVFHNFLSDVEIDTLLALTKSELKRSTDQGDFDESGVQAQVVSKGRTSSNAWCNANCEAHPIVKGISKRIERVTGIPLLNYESFQILRYEKGQKYDVHHDMGKSDVEMPSGPRILTFFLYLSDVEEGGGTSFPTIRNRETPLVMNPERGAAIIWPSVLSENMNVQHPETFHSATPVVAGVKYAANHWIHLRDYKTPNLWACTGSVTT